MRLIKSLVLAISALSLASVIDTSNASACGGCIVVETENTQVSSHRMILSISNTQTTLWDQIKYTGNPSSFAWVLPIKGQVDIGLSSDAMFETLDVLTQTTISSPVINCGSPCGPFAGGSDSNGGSTGSGGGGVVVIAEKVVGPYATVQLAANDPAALKDWLTMNGYFLPADVAPVVDAYLAEGFGFLAMKLVPGQGIDSMRPVRVTSPGAVPTLPLRMVAAGTGAITPITLFVMGEGRYDPTNFPTFEVDPNKLIWNWDTSSSNYKDLRAEGFATANGKTWLMEAAEPMSSYSIEWPLKDLVTYDQPNSGYGDDMGLMASEELTADLEALYGTLDPNSFWVSRMYAELPRSALATDLIIGAAANQANVTRYFQVNQTVGTAPSCPPQPACPDPPDSNNDDTWNGYWGPDGQANGGGGGCSMGGVSGTESALSVLGLSFALMVSRRRRRSAR